ncbi:fumarylacetoacetate hydrolase family protein [Mycobacterium deserti]|uniref:Fumarylacetoacetate hydrolase family protein n=1 Tax=Mycobacterium deserti TaxID=2978347 RepID=A0ABT2M6Y1_9MYCO|nr:fumarylacetoacetate hydrolase family protein [Mycobacterium deserti]MCT7658024.1 fumarylacetoacetate hydrolase family protein [Mycobacterium deserti]
METDPKFSQSLGWTAAALAKDKSGGLTMAYATYLQDGTTQVGEVHGDQLIPLSGIAELGTGTVPETLAAAVRDESAAVPVADVTMCPVVPNPSKVICVGLNYRDHIHETRRETPKYPVLFPKYASNLIGAYDDIVLPPEVAQPDYEGELAVVIGRAGRRISEDDAPDYVLGYTVANDVTMRDFQYKTHQWMQGKAWDASTPVGPILVRPEEIDLDAAGIRTLLNGEKVQESEINQLLFTVPNLIATISVFTELRPGDLILTGTPGGVGYRRDPQLLLSDGDSVIVEIDGIGATKNTVRTST